MPTSIPIELVEDMKALGLVWRADRSEYGGLGLSASLYAKIVTRISEEWMSLTGIFNSHLMMAQIVHASARINKKTIGCRNLRPVNCAAALALTEPNAGTDLQA